MEFFTSSISEQAIEQVVACLTSSFVSEGKIVENFERKLTDSLGIINPITVNSGTSALHLGMLLADVKAGDEVILPAQTFIASALAILYVGAKPVFADIDPKTANICTRSIKKKITEKTKAIMPVHWAGYPCDMDEINDLAKTHKLAVVEDAAHALSSIYKGKPIGAISQYTCFSFQAIKHLTTGDGGAIACLSNSEADKAKRLRWFGIDRVNHKVHALGERDYNLKEVGYKYHMNNVCAAIGLGNLESLDRTLARRDHIAARYFKEIKQHSGLEFMDYKDDRKSSYWLFPLLIQKRMDFINALKAAGVPASVVHMRIDRNEICGGIQEDLIGQTHFDANQIHIPIHHDMTENEVDLVISTINKGW